MNLIEWLKDHIPSLSPKRRELFATFLLNLAVACLAVAAFEGKWWGQLLQVSVFGVLPKFRKDFKMGIWIFIGCFAFIMGLWGIYENHRQEKLKAEEPDAK